jgi:hypothetical protein
MFRTPVWPQAERKKSASAPLTMSIELLMIIVPLSSFANKAGA